VKRLIKNSRLPDRFGVCRETIWRWKNDPAVEFPKPDAIINGQEYYYEETLDEFDRATVAKRAAKRCKAETV